MSISNLDTKQWKSVVKAALYAFFAGAAGLLTLNALDIIKAAQDGKTAIFNLFLAVLAGAVIGGINGVVVFIKKLFTPVQ